MNYKSVVAVALALACARGTPAAIDSASVPPLEYQIRYAGDSGTLTVALRASALGSSSSNVVLELPNWGEWTSARDPYVRDLRVNRRAFAFDSAGRLRVPRDLAVGGELLISYQLGLRAAGSAAHQERRLLPYRDSTHMFGFAINTFAQLLVDDRPVRRPSIVRVAASPNDEIFTGWGGRSVAQQTATGSVELPAENGVFSIGRVAGFATRSVNGVPVEIAQFAAGDDLTGEIAQYVESLVIAMSRTTGRGPRGPLRIIFEPQRNEGVFGGTLTNDGLVIRVPAEPFSLMARLTLAHEVFHDWLGSHLVPDESVTWFNEGFTDYISLWHAAATGVVTPAQFAARMMDIERDARRSTSLGRTRFAEPGIQWRDADGPNETMAYRGGALVAFVTDMQLRQRGASVMDVIRHLLSRPKREYGIDDIRNAITRAGASDVYAQFIDGTKVPTVRPMLLAAGFDEGPVQSASLTYLGIEARYDGADSLGIVPSVVLAIDPAGPAAKTDLRVGDRIIDIGDLRGDPPMIGRAEPIRYRFGLNVVPTGARSVPLRVVRNGTVIEVGVAPVLWAGGVRYPLRWNPERGTQFFTVQK
ncbi:MAG TPA: hypothetical protein VJR92_15200 [Gemmatimonadaceae bacterium]|nr:hypothetical protein [Gemmatimonadaceae bacterium]